MPAWLARSRYRAERARQRLLDRPSWVDAPATEIERLAAIEWLRQAESAAWLELARACLDLVLLVVALLTPVLAGLAAGWATWRMR